MKVHCFNCNKIIPELKSGHFRNRIYICGSCVVVAAQENPDLFNEIDQTCSQLMIQQNELLNSIGVDGKIEEGSKPVVRYAEVKTGGGIRLYASLLSPSESRKDGWEIWPPDGLFPISPDEGLRIMQEQIDKFGPDARYWVRLCAAGHQQWSSHAAEQPSIKCDSTGDGHVCGAEIVAMETQITGEELIRTFTLSLMSGTPVIADQEVDVEETKE